MKELVVLPSAIALLTAFQVVAQNADGKVDPGISSLVGNLGVVGVLAWFLWYQTTHSQPKMLSSFAAESKAMRDTFQDDQKEQREVFKAEQAELRRLFKEEQQEARELFLREQAALRDYNARETAELRKLVAAVSADARKAVHDMRDAGQVTLNKAQEIVSQAGADPRATPKPPGGQG